jgi:hypothetical protein
MEFEFEFLKSEAVLQSLVERWQSRTLPGREFTHAAHLATCAYLAFDYRGAKLAQAMKRGLIRFNASVGTANTEDRGYHETLTRFWCLLIEKSVATQVTRLGAARTVVAQYGEDRLVCDRYYSFDVPKSREARKMWIPPDMAEL